MKKIIILFLLLFIATSIAPTFAINWKEAYTPSGQAVYIDTDSIKEEDNYYFYNIKIKNSSKKDYKVITVQSNHARPFSATIKTYTEKEYIDLKGDYDNITKNKTQNLEPVTYNSTIHTCYKKVKQIFQNSNKPKIIID